jgi:hypothetical protein
MVFISGMDILKVDSDVLALVHFRYCCLQFFSIFHIFQLPWTIHNAGVFLPQGRDRHLEVVPLCFSALGEAKLDPWYSVPAFSVYTRFLSGAWR